MYMRFCYNPNPLENFDVTDLLMYGDNLKTCDWGRVSEITRRHHDEEWGMPVRTDRRQFEYLMMEVLQCGLSWDLMKKRETFCAAFDQFDFGKIAAYGETDIERVLAHDGMIRSRRKVEASICNARMFLRATLS